MNTDRFTFKKTFTHTGNDFSALQAATKWLRENELTMGTLQSPEPCAIVKCADYVVETLFRGR